MKAITPNRNTRVAILALVLFALFDIVGLSLNYFLSWRIEAQAIGINLAGRQRMLSQRMVKVLLQIDSARRSGEPTKAYFEELKLTFDLFDNTLRGFDIGHETKGGAGEALFLPPVIEPKARQAVSEAVALWADYRSKVVILLENGEKSDDAILQAALADARARNLKLLGLMNSLTTELELLTQHEAQLIRLYQVGALGLALLCFMVAIVLFRRREAEIIQARQLATEAAYAEREYVAGMVASATQRLQMADEIPALAHQLFAVLAPALSIGCAAYYRFDSDSGMLVASGHYAQGGELSIPGQIALDDSLVGECAKDRQVRVIVGPPASYLRAQTGLASATPEAIVLLPVLADDVLLGVIELALLKALDRRHEEVLQGILPLVAMRMEIIARNEGLRKGN